MKKLIKAIEKMKPFFDAVARNVYLKSETVSSFV